MDPIITAFVQLGVAGAAIGVMYLMYKDAASRLSEKDNAMIRQVEKHEGTLKEHQIYMREIHASTMIQLGHASKIIEENSKSHERVITMLNERK